jgi:hypothetical protein
MREGVPRALLALTALVALAIIFFVVRDYVRGERATSPESTTNPMTAKSNSVDVKTTTLVKTSRHAKSVATVENSAATSKAAADDVEKQAMLNALMAHATHDEEEPVLENNQGDDTVNMKILSPTLSAPQCVPLPNVTKPGDADGPYYQNWAREYSCQYSPSNRARLLPRQSAPKR